MDYEKKYKEALEVMRQWIAPCHDAKQLEVLKKSVFPELRESEDERIRKYLVEELKAAKSVGELKFTIPQPTREECIAYLEKQKEQKPALKQTLDAYKISDERATAKMEGRIEGRQDVINNPEEYGLQKPAEWSEEDEDNLKAIIRIIEDNDSDWKELTDWLKSLRPVSKESLQPHWNPSKEQMDALKDVAYGTYQNGNGPALRSLYEQLKKLGVKEEPEYYQHFDPNC